jgi:hypothetical protein
VIEVDAVASAEWKMAAIAIKVIERDARCFAPKAVLQPFRQPALA